MASPQTMVSSSSGKYHLPLGIATTLSYLTHRQSTYDPDNDVKDVVCVGMDIMPPPGSRSITEDASIECGDNYKRLWMRVYYLDAGYMHEAVSMELVRDGEFKARIYTWMEVKQMVDVKDVVDAPTPLPMHIDQSLTFGRSLPFCKAGGKAGGVIVVGGDIDVYSDASCLVNDPTNPKYLSVGLLKVMNDKPPYAIISNPAEYFVNRGGSVWVFRD